MPYENKTRKLIADEFLKALKEDTIPWAKSWINPKRENPFHNMSHKTQTEYRGINQFVLEFESQNRGYSSNEWMTFNQMKEKGYHFRKDEHGNSLGKGAGVPLELFKPWDYKEHKSLTFKEYDQLMKTADESRRKTLGIIVKNYYVFNTDLIEELYKESKEPNIISKNGANENCKLANTVLDTYAKNEGILITENPGDRRAYYSPQEDSINLPPFESFDTPESFLATKAHEIAHSTGTPERCNRKLENFFGTKDYAIEELRAEIGAAIMTAEMGIDTSKGIDNMENHKAYVQDWIKRIEDKPTQLFSAIKDAFTLSDYVLEKGEKDKIFTEYLQAKEAYVKVQKTMENSVVYKTPVNEPSVSITEDYDQALKKADEKISRLDEPLNDLASKMREESYQKNPPAKGKDGYTPAQREYYGALKKSQEAKAERRNLINKKVAKEEINF